MHRIAPPLLDWYDAGHRRFPWRGISDLYRIWVSEIMLQQTRVQTVLQRGYYHRFLERFPTVAALAAADEDDVLAVWSGLGFYRRARNLHAGARLVVSEHGGEMPEDPEALGSLPGIGRYTVGAILSSGRNQKLPILDGNVIRVLSRLCQVDGAIDRSATLAELWRLAEEALPDGRPGDFNQALMDLGATVCVPRHPDCGACPLAGGCLARAAGSQEDYPRPGKRTKVTFEVRVAVMLTRADGRFAVCRRPPDGLLPNLWELPAATVQDGVDPASVAAVIAGSDVRACRTVEHRFSHRHWTTHVFRAAAGGERAEVRWVTHEELSTLGLPTVSRKAIEAALA
jgi:A/G-specific adenine glycosylase